MHANDFLSKKTLNIASVLLAGSLLLTGCGDGAAGSQDSGASAAATAGSAHDKADAMFAQEMIPHHGQAIEMAGMAKTRASSPQVRKLAADIEIAQAPEIDKMTDWLKAWGENLPATGRTNRAGMSGMGQRGGQSMPGMMTTAEMNRLARARGRAFDRMFLEMMIEHHQGALEMARTEEAEGRSPEAIRLAKSIRASQTAQIATMRRMLGS